MISFTSTSQSALDVQGLRTNPILHHSMPRWAASSLTWTFWSVLYTDRLITTRNIYRSAQRWCGSSLKLTSRFVFPSKWLLSTPSPHHLFHIWTVNSHLTHTNIPTHPPYKRNAYKDKFASLSFKLRCQLTSGFIVSDLFHPCSVLLQILRYVFTVTWQHTFLIFFSCYFRSIFTTIYRVARSSVTPLSVLLQGFLLRMDSIIQRYLFNFTVSQGFYTRQLQSRACAEVETIVTERWLDVSCLSAYLRDFEMSGSTVIKKKNTSKVQEEVAICNKTAQSKSDRDVLDFIWACI